MLEIETTYQYHPARSETLEFEQGCRGSSIHKLSPIHKLTSNSQVKSVYKSIVKTAGLRYFRAWSTAQCYILVHPTTVVSHIELNTLLCVRLTRNFAKNRYTLSLWCQKQVHSKTKYKSHPRSPAIGQPHIVPVFGLKRPGTPGLSTLSGFQLFLANFEPIRVHTLVPRHLSYDT